MANTRYIYAKEFISGRIEKLKDLIDSDVYLSFLPLTVLIELLGKINNPNCNNWNCENPKKNFYLGIDRLPIEYQVHKDVLYKSLRCGFAHSLLPQKDIDITHRKEATVLGTKHLKADNNGNIIIIAEDLMFDIENALNHDLSKQYDADDKMNKPVLFVPVL